MLTIYVDADGCPVKDEVLRVADRYGLHAVFVANTGLSLPKRETVELVVVKSGSDVADDWIAEHAEERDIVVTADIPLAARCIEKGACVLDPRGRERKEDDIGAALASRDLMEELRGAGVTTGGPKPFEQRDRSNFLQSLDRVVQRIRRQR